MGRFERGLAKIPPREPAAAGQPPTSDPAAANPVLVHAEWRDGTPVAVTSTGQVVGTIDLDELVAMDGLA
jgi:hypothetical protein